MKKIGIIVNTHKTDNTNSVLKVVNSLKERADVYVVSDCAVDNVKLLSMDELVKTVDIMLIMGGDGTIIRAANECAQYDIPVLGINLGRIGFMAEIEVEEIESAVDKLLCGDYRIENRMMIEAEIRKNGKVVKKCNSLNDIIISKAAGVKIVGLDLYTDGDIVNSYIGDGLIVSTPTGSTGYSISAGGPVVDPIMNLFVATPICAHMLSTRTVILPSEKEIVIKQNQKFGFEKAIVSSDGDVVYEIEENEEVIIRRSPYELELIRIGNQSFYNTVIEKLT